MDIKKEYCFAGRAWSYTEEEQLKKEYTIDKLNLMELSKIHKRLPGGITCRLRKINLISFAQETRGYSEYQRSELYKLVSENKKEEQKQDLEENQTILTPISVERPRRRMANELQLLREELKEMKQYIKEVHSLMNQIYEFETQVRQQEETKEMPPTTPTENAFTRIMKPKVEAPFTPDYYVYTDGACSNNGQVSAVAGIGIYFAENDPRNVSRKVEGKQSNNTAELGAILYTYPIIEADILAGKRIKIVSDSQYAIRCATTYGEKCASQGWSKDIPNKELVKEVYDLYKNKSNVKFIHILSHTGNTDVHSMGNDGADKLANQAIGLESCPYNRQEERLYLNVPFEKKDEIKALGGRWDFPKKKWYILNTSEHVSEVLTKFKTAF